MSGVENTFSKISGLLLSSLYSLKILLPAEIRASVNIEIPSKASYTIGSILQILMFELSFSPFAFGLSPTERETIICV